MLPSSSRRTTTGASGGGGYNQAHHQPSTTIHGDRGLLGNHTTITVIPFNSSVKSNNTNSRFSSHPVSSHQPPSDTSPSMIGPTSTAYRQEYRSNNEIDSDLQQYQQWIDSFAAQQQQLAPVADLHHGNWSSEGRQQFEFTFNHSPYSTTHPSAGYMTDSVDLPSRTHETVSLSGTEYGGLQSQQFLSEFYSDTPTSLAPISAPSNIAYTRTTFTSNPYPANAENNGEQHALTHQQQAQHPSHQFISVSPYSTLVGSAAGNDTSSPVDSRESTSISPSSATVSPATENFRVNVAKQTYHGRQDSGYGLSPDSDAVSNNAAGPPTASMLGTPTKRFARSNSSRSKRKRRKKDTTSDVVNPGTGLSESDSEEDSETEFAGGISVGVGGLGVVGRPGKGLGQRTSGACAHCKKLKMKCAFPKGENTCRRCKLGGHVCIVEARKPRIPANKREYLLAQLRQKDAIIESLLKQLHNPYQATPMSIASYQMATSPSDRNNCDTMEWLSRLKSSLKASDGKLFTNLRPERATNKDSEADDGATKPQVEHFSGFEDAEDGVRDEKLESLHVPLDLLANLSLDNTKLRKQRKKGSDKGLLNEDDANDTDIGVANETFFMPGPATDLDARALLIEQHSPPEIVLHGLVTPEDVEQLFEIFYEHINPFISILDPVLHTPASTFARCPFLFTVVCAISSRYYAKKSEIYPIAMHFAKHSAANALVDGWKSVELCQAYILLSVYAVPARRWEEDRSWLYTGLAIRLATDLNLHHFSSSKPQTEKQEREILNKERVWMICCNLDRSTATQFGKPSTIKEHYIMRHSKDWYKKSKFNHPYDIHLCGYSMLLQIVARFHDEIFSDPSSPTGLNKGVDFRSVTLAHDERLTKFQEEWTMRFLHDSDRADRASAFRCSLLPYYVGYSRLVMFSFGFQQAYRRGLQQDDHIFFAKCMMAAKSVVTNMIEGLVPSGYMRYAPDGHFVFASFASAFLLKLLRPELSHLLSKDEEMDIFVLISRLIQTLSSQKIAVDDKHTPKLFARFLAGLLARHRRARIAGGDHHEAPTPHNPAPPSERPAISVQNSSENVIAFEAPQFQTHDVAGNDIMYNILDQQVEVNTYGPDVTFTDAEMPFVIDSNFAENNMIPEEELLATMQIIKNPTWWQNMMLPGFSWPEQSPSPSSNGVTPPPYVGADHAANHNQANNLYLT